jgi:hypothetical protein
MAIHHPSRRCGSGLALPEAQDTAETALPGWACRTRTCKRHFEKATEMLGEFSLDYGTFWDRRLFACELPGD